MVSPPPKKKSNQVKAGDAVWPRKPFFLVTHTHNPSTEEVEAGGSEVHGYSWLQHQVQSQSRLQESLLKKTTALLSS